MKDAISKTLRSKVFSVGIVRQDEKYRYEIAYNTSLCTELRAFPLPASRTMEIMYKMAGGLSITSVSTTRRPCAVAN
jgi:hypothetical protein